MNKDVDKDTQLQYAISFLDGKAKGPETSSATPPDAPAAKPSTDGGDKKVPVPSSDDDKKVTPN